MELSKYIGSKIKELRDKRGWDQDTLANKLSISRVSISRYESGARKANQDILFKLADVFNVSINEFFPMPTNVKPVENVRKIPVLGQIACGDPITAEENIEEYRAAIEDLLPDGNLFFLKAKGNSMAPTIPNGSYVLIREQPDVEDGEIAAILVDNDNEATLKRVRRQQGAVMLMPDNPEYAPIILSKDYPGRIIGKAMKFTSDL